VSDAAVPDSAEDCALVAYLRAMTARGVPPRPVRCFLWAAAEAAFAQLRHRAGAGDATGALRVSRPIEGRRSAAERLLHHHLIPPAPQSMEVV
jgi:transcription initiation factor TFIIIB Brf1 subunit/transcription initiation factor TFIIB